MADDEVDDGGEGNEGEGLSDLAGDEEWFKTLLKKPIFYTRTREGNKRFLASDGLLVVPDDEKCVELFSEHVDILAVPVQDLPALKPLLKKVMPRLLFLSEIVESKPEALGIKDRNVEFEQRLREVMPLVGRYAQFISKFWHICCNDIRTCQSSPGAFTIGPHLIIITSLANSDT